MTTSDSPGLPITSTYADFAGPMPFSARLRDVARNAAIGALSLGRRIDRDTGWIRFPYYHHVFDDERAGFERQIAYLARFGDFLSLDDALVLLDGENSIDGRYFCISFDDGFKTCFTGALPILAARGIPATVYLVSDFVGRSLSPDDPIARNDFGFRGHDTTLDFLDWTECRKMIDAGVTMGSHGMSHRRLAPMDEAAAAREIAGSKVTIERELGQSCVHFCPPFGLPVHDFDESRDPGLARDAGYRSFVTGQRGPARCGTDPFSIGRDHMLAGWPPHQLRYFLSLS